MSGRAWMEMYVKASQIEDMIIQILNAKYLILNTSDYEHDYPFCWRCDTPLLYYTKNSWFIKCRRLKQRTS